MESDRNWKETISEKATISAIAKRRNAVKILIFLTKNDDAFYLQEVADTLDMNEMTAFSNLSKLVDAGMVVKSGVKVDARTKYYEVMNKKLAEKVIEKYKSLVAFRLARLIPYERTYAEQLKNDSRFVKVCQYYGLNIDEGVNAVRLCSKIGYERDSNRLILWRKEQGYILEKPKEPEKFETRVEEVE